MKILLISSNTASTPYPTYPLGLSMVAAALKNAGYDVYQFDFLENDCSLEKLAYKIKQYDPDIIGISIRNIDNVNLLNEQRYIDAVRNIVKKIRQETEAKVVIGGSGFSIMPDVILREVGADYGVVGEGEKLMVEFVNNARQGKYPEQRCIKSSLKLSANEIPSAFYDPHIMKFYLKSGNIASVQTKRGCANKCVYCSYPVLEGSTIRCRSPLSVVDDIQTLIDKHNVKYIFFVDSVFNDDKGRYLDVLYEMKKRDIFVPWTAFFKPDDFDDSHVELMKQTGLKAAEIGADAASNTTLKKLGKLFQFNDIIKSNDIFVRHGISTAHYYMFGCPGETKETVMEGIHNIINLKKTVSFIFMGIRILPGTHLAQTAIKQGIISRDQELLEPVYYIAPGIDKHWLENTLNDAFKGLRHCIFPPDVLDGSLQFLHKLGYSGSVWDMLIPKDDKTANKKTI